MKESALDLRFVVLSTFVMMIILEMIKYKPQFLHKIDGLIGSFVGLIGIKLLFKLL